MVFSSLTYVLIFLPVVLAVFYGLLSFDRINQAKIWLVLASLVFYSYWEVKYLPLILFSIGVNFLLSRKIIGDGTANKHILIFGIFFNASLLGYFKYLTFFADNVNIIFDTTFHVGHILLPLAISFFTFQQIAYLVDCYRGEAREYDFLNYTLFVTFFPQLIAGPIVHHKEMMPQFERLSAKGIQHALIMQGLVVFTIGLFKKVMVADTFALWADAGFDSEGTLAFQDAWLASFSYTFQLYFDFSGYSDMAIGAALMMGIKLPVNFDSPYKARNIREFWQRWHMTLSRWIRDYIYIPLGGSRQGEPRKAANIFLSFLFSGLWHGAGWTFVLWGALHGAGVLVLMLWEKMKIRVPTWLSCAITFIFVSMAFVVFRAETVEKASQIIAGMLVLPGGLIAGQESVVFDANTRLLAWVFTLFFACVAFLAPNSLEISGFKTDRPGDVCRKQYAIIGGLAFGACLLVMLNIQGSVFLYFNF